MERTSGRRDTDGTLKRIGEAVRQRRLDIGLAQETLADAASIDRSHMGKIERGERNVTILLLCRVSVALDVPLHELLSSAGV